MKTKIKYFSILLLLFFSLLSPIGYIVKNQDLIFLGKKLGLSPLPRPFRNLGNSNENFSATFKIYCSNNGLEQNINTQVENLLNGNRPHRAKVMFYNLAQYSYAISHNTREKILNRLCVLCSKGMLTAMTHYKNDVIQTRTTCN